MINNTQRVKLSLDEMFKKNRLPERSKTLFNDQTLAQTEFYHNQQTFKNWTCKTCFISVYGPKKLMLEHHKTHIPNGGELKDNEPFISEFNLF